MTLLIAVFVFLTFIVKKDSTSGRWFIYQRTIELINKRPLLGWGRNGFEQQYMNVQGYYLEHHPTGKYTMLADEIKHPLNEYLNIAVNYGLLGVSLIVVVIYLIFRYYNRHSSKISEVGFCTLLSIICFSMFSYPFSYPFTWIICFFSLSAIFHKDLVSMARDNKYRRYLCIVFLLCFILITPSLYNKINNDIRWKKISEYAKYGVSKKMMSRYDNLYLQMHDNPYFLYNYAAEEYNAGRYRDALAKAKECQYLFQDYDLEMLMADCYQSLNNTQMAIYHYHKAHYMIPSRLMPYYGEFDVYRQCNDKVNGRRMAYIILALPVKVRSYSTKRIKDEAKSYIISEENTLNQ
jgi:tetratricopeptide (TPR) repeat protein